MNDPSTVHLKSENLSYYENFFSIQSFDINIEDETEYTLNKKQFVFEHSSDNIREDYLIGKVLGTGNIYLYMMFAGAFGEVRLCTHRKTGANRAVKIIKKSFLKGKEEVRFLSEIEILK